jgi:ABC-type spermidine/putrescine transport system permease subunit II
VETREQRWEDQGVTAPPRYATEPERSVPLAPLALLLSVLVAPVGLVLGVIALRRIRRDDEPGKHTAVAAIAVGTLVTIAYVALAVAVIVLFVQLHHLQGPVPPSLTRTAP